MKSNLMNLFVGLTLLTALFQMGFDTANAGTNTGGGGSEIEAGFKAKVLVLVRQAVEFSPISRAQLQFDPFVVASRLSMPNSLKPTCATGNALAEIIKLNKMAYVFNPNSGVVFLDCTTYSLKDWRTLFISQRLEQAPFFLHEALRTLSVENENDYSKSSSFIAAVMANPQYLAEVKIRQTSMLLSSELGRCYIDLDNNNGRFAAFIVDGRVIDSHRFNSRDDSVVAMARRVLLEPNIIEVNTHFHDDVAPLRIFRDRALARAKDLGCF